MLLQATSDAGKPTAPQRQFLPAALIVVVTLLGYIPAMQGGFFWDDHSFLVRNEIIHARDGLRRFWLTTEAQDYFPLTSTLLWVEWRLCGASAAGYHVVNVLLHASAAVLAWRVLRRLNVAGAWLAGILFAVHPVAAASAAWVTESKNTLTMVLFLLSLLAYLTYEERAEPPGGPPRRSKGWYALAIVLFLLALLAKTSVVMLPAVLLLCAWWRRGRISVKDLFRSLPFFALSLGLGLVTIWFQKHNVIGAEVVRPEGFCSRLAAAGWMVWFYLFKLLFPAGLCVIYPRWNVDGASFLAFAPLTLLVAGLALLWLHRNDWSRAPLFALAYFLMMLLPTLGFVDMAFMRFSLVADHFQYAAMIGPVAFAAALLSRGAAAAGLRGRTGKFAAAGCVAVLACLAHHRAGLYGAEERLWKDNLAKNPAPIAARLAWRHLSDTYVRAGRYEDALDSFDHWIALEPDSADAYYDRAAIYFDLGRYPSAIGDYDKAVQLNPNSAAAFNNRGNAYAADHRLREAIRDYQKAMALEPRSALPYFNRANARRQIGQTAEAIQDFSKAIALKPEYPEAYNNRAAAYFELKEYGKARADVEMCARLGGRPDPALVQALAEASEQKVPR
jgi:tetratricopeptide (TPR) repeat protein